MADSKRKADSHPDHSSKKGKADVATQYFYTNIEGSEDSATVFFFTPKDSSKKDDAAADLEKVLDDAKHWKMLDEGRLYKFEGSADDGKKLLTELGFEYNAEITASDAEEGEEDDDDGEEGSSGEDDGDVNDGGDDDDDDDGEGEGADSDEEEDGDDDEDE